MASFRSRAASLVAFVLVFSSVLPAAAAEKDDRSFAKAADSLIQLFIGQPASAPAPTSPVKPQRRTVQHVSTAPVRPAHTVARVEEHRAAPAPVHAALAVPASQPVLAPVHAVAVHPVAKRVASAPKHAATKHAKSSAAADDWLKDAGPQGPEAPGAGEPAH